MKIAIGSDHAGFQLKEELKVFLKEKGINVKDFGTYSEESVDYPDYAIPLAESVARGEEKFGILICGTGIGMCASLCGSEYSARCAREHNDANVLCLAGRVLKEELAKEIVNAWLDTSFLAGRHKRRIDKITNYEKK